MKGKHESKMIAPFEKTSPLTREECLCPCCWSILIEPVTLPCKHSICLACFKQHLNENLCCPCCRERISNWSRRVLKTNKLVNQPFWERLKKELPLFVQARLDGQDSQDVLTAINMECDNSDSDVNSNNLNLLLEASDSLNSIHKPIVDGELVNNSGELLKDYESIHKKHIEDMENRKQKDEMASVEFIKKLQEEEWHIPRLPTDIQTSQSSASTSSKPTNDHVAHNGKNGHQSRKLARNLLTEWDGDSKLPSSSSSLLSPLQLLNKSAEDKKTKNGENFHLNTTTSTTVVSSPLVHSSASSSVTTSSTTTNTTATEDIQRSSILKTTTTSLIQPPPGSSSSSSFVFVHGPQTAITTPSTATTALKSSEESKSDTKTISFNPIQVNFHKSSSTPDSINVELCHFRPIRSAPKTPPKRNPDGTYLPEPAIVKSKPIRIRSISTEDETSNFAGVSSSSTRNIENPVEVSMEVEITSDPNSPNISKKSPSNTLEEGEPSVTEVNSDQVDSVNDRNHDDQEKQDMLQPLTSFNVEEPEEEEVSPGQNSDCENQEGERQNGDDEEQDEVDDPEKAEREYFLLQAVKLEQFKKKKLQEDEDRKFAEMLQKTLNPTHYPVRSRDSSDRYAIRNWARSNNNNNADTTSQQEASTLTTSNSMLSPDSRLRTRRKRSRATSSPTSSSRNGSINNSSSATTRQTKAIRTASDSGSGSNSRSSSSKIRGNNRPYNTRTKKKTSSSSSSTSASSTTTSNSMSAQNQQQQPRKRGRPKKVTH